MIRSPDVPYPKALARFPEIRQSTLSTFDACALSSHFDMSYRRGWSTHPQGRGRLFHRFAGHAFRLMREMGETSIDVDTALGILAEVLTQDDADRECPFCGSEKILPGLSQRMERTCSSCGRLFETEFVNVPGKEISDLYMVVKKWSHDNEFDIGHLIDVEKRMRASVHYSVRGVSVDRVLTGMPDVLFVDPHDPDHVVVIDWKDTWAMPAASEVSEEGYFQQRFYAWLVMHTYHSVERVTLREFYVRYSQPREATLWRHDLDQLDAEFAALAQRFDRAIEEDVFLPSPGHHCRFCIRPQKCPIPVFVRGDGRITNERRAKQVAAELVVGNRVVKKATTELMAWCRDNGSVEVKDGKGKRVFGFVSSDRTDRPTQEQMERAMLETGRPLTSAEVKALYRTKTITKFIDHAPPREEESQNGDKKLIDSLARSIHRAAVRKGLV